MKKTKNKGSKINKTVVAVGVVGVAAAAVGAYWFYGSKNSAKHRKAVGSWMLKARAEVMEAVEKVGDVNKETYLRIVDNVMQKYVGLRHTASDIAAITKEIKSAWSHVQAAVSSTKKVAKKVTNKAPKGK